jgi:protein-tyrosine phosphatase
VTEDSPRTAAGLKARLRKLVPYSLLKQRDIILRLGPAGRTYVRLRLLDTLGLRASNPRLVPSSARSFLFVCFGNIMRSAMAEFLMRQALDECGSTGHVQITSAGLHAIAGRVAHPWAQQASAELGISLAQHRAKPLTPATVQQADCILAMDFQNKAELLTRYPEARNRIYMLSSYGERPWRNREISDPYLGDLEVTRLCARQLQICIRSLISTLRL